MQKKTRQSLKLQTKHKKSQRKSKQIAQIMKSHNIKTPIQCLCFGKTPSNAMLLGSVVHDTDGSRYAVKYSRQFLLGVRKE
jgi:hypothetical protein